MTPVERNDPLLGLLKASTKVRDGRWIEGAPTHILGELLNALKSDGWRLYRPCPGCCNCAPSNFNDPMCDGSGERFASGEWRPMPDSSESQSTTADRATETRTSDLRFRLALAFRDEFVHGSILSECGPGADTCPDWPLAYRLADLALGVPGLVSDDTSYTRGHQAGYADAFSVVVSYAEERLRDARSL